MSLRTDFQDDVLDATKNLYRQYQMIKNDNGTVSFVDVTTYSQVGDTLGAAQLNEITQEINNLGESVADGKASIASAITNKGVDTESDATFATMAANIEQIETDPVLQSKTASLSTTKQTIKPDSGYDGLSQVVVPAIAGTAAVSHVLSGKTFNSATAGVSKTGTMANKAGTTVKAGAVTQDDSNTYFSVPAAGYYDTSSKVYTENSNLSKLETLWSGEHNYSAFTLDIDISKYKMIVIEWEYYVGRVSMLSCVQVGQQSVISAGDYMNGSQYSKNCQMRTVNLTDTSKIVISATMGNPESNYANIYNIYGV